ncbi:MAG: terminase family protein [Sphingomonadaceae bacterium]|nr:terminase family protein [Sphingomonadaceae bacterium]
MPGLGDRARSAGELLGRFGTRVPPALGAFVVRQLRILGRDRWALTARPAQLAPRGRWDTWLIMAGRGFGKTRAGAEWVRQLAEGNARARIALVGATLADVRDVMVLGESGLVAIAPPRRRPVLEVSRRRLVWPNGAQAFLYSAEEPGQLRGPQHHAAWCDELAKWPNCEAVWDNLKLGLRLGQRPRAVVTTTPRPVALLKALLADSRTRVTRGRTSENAENLPPAFLDAVTARYAGTRLGRQELDGELIEEVPGALWSRALIERCRADAKPGLVRVVVGVDPPAGAGDGADACGIVACGVGHDGRAYVLGDRSVQGRSPEGWARAVAAAAREFDADRVVAEVNNGGAMVEAVLKGVEPGLPVKPVRAAHGKVARAEPVAALYEAGRVLHLGALPELEDELCGLIAGGAYAGPGRSPDRADAAVWALTELMLGRPALGSPAFRVI